MRLLQVAEEVIQRNPTTQILLRRLSSMASLRGVLTKVSSYCQRSFSQSHLWGSAVNQARMISTTPMKWGTKIGVKRNVADHKRRLLAARFELRRRFYKAFCRDQQLPSEMREKFRYKLSKLPRNSSFVRVKNRCILTGRPRSVHELFRMSRICFRDLANKGELMGIIKSSW